MMCESKRDWLPFVACMFFLVWLVASPAAAQVAGGDAVAPAAAPDEAAPAEERPSLDPATETDPFVRAILEVKPTTPEQWLQDARALLNLNRIDLVKEYLRQFTAVQPAAAELAALQGRFGSDFFLRLSTTAGLQPEGAAVADVIMQAADDRIKNAARLSGLIDRLTSDDQAARRLAMAELVQAGAVAVPGLVTVMADGARAQQHAPAAATLVAIGSASIDPVIAALESPDNALRGQLIRVLAELRAQPAIPYLLSPALAEGEDAAVAEAARAALQAVLGGPVTREEAQRYLQRRLDSYLDGTLPADLDEQGQVATWVWDVTQQLPVLQRLPAGDASFVAAARVAAQLHAIAPEEADHQVLYLATGLEVAKRLGGYERPLAEQTAPILAVATAADPATLEDVLALALKKQMEGAAIATIDLLGGTGNLELLQSSDGQPRLLVEALRSHYRRVQFAAARAILTLGPQTAYAGSSYLPEVLGFLSASGGRRRVLIGEPRAEVARTIAGWHDLLGFDVDTKVMGREFLLQAVSSPDYAFVLIGDAINRPAYRELVQTLRRDPRTADLPVGLMVREINEESAEWFSHSDPLTLSFPEPQSQEDVAVDTRRLLVAAARRQLTDNERTREAIFALDALAQLAQDPETYAFYDLLRLEPQLQTALANAALVSRASQVLGLLATPGAQQALVDLASSHVLPLVERQAAASAFRLAVERRGLLLTGPQLKRQYDLYNGSEVLDEGTQQVLSSILDTIEAPTRKTDAPQKDN